jgi:hypothetical protein
MLPGCFASRLSSFFSVPGNALPITERVKLFGGIASTVLSELLFVVVHDDSTRRKESATGMLKERFQ